MNYAKQNVLPTPHEDVQKLINAVLKELSIDEKSYVKYAVSLTNVDLKHIEWKYNFFGKQVKFFKNYSNAPTAQKLYTYLKDLGFQDGGLDKLDSTLVSTLFIYFNQP